MIANGAISSPDKRWYLYVDEKRRHNLLRILAEISRRQSKTDPYFILIGALSLLIRGLLDYTVFWDVDLLFKDRLSLEGFSKMEKSPGLRIVHYDDELQEGKEITSLHTLWSFDKTWFNVDYILRPPFFEFHYSIVDTESPYSEEVTIDGRHYSIHLIAAHPWNIFVEKLLSPRLESEVSLQGSFPVDARHLLIILQADSNNHQFWTHIAEAAARLGKTEIIKRTLFRLLASAKAFGYDIELTDSIMKKIEAL